MADKQWPEAVDEYLHIFEEAGDDLVPLDSDHSICARRLCHQRLAALPPEALRLYRDYVESQTKKWFEQGKAEREPRLLRRLVEEAFCSRYTDRALDLMGDLAFERGRFGEAESWWNMIALAASRVASAPGAENNSHNQDLLFPDPQVDVARVRAKQLLARLFAGNRDHWQEDLIAFRALHDKDQGDLAGQSGRYAEILEAIAKKPEMQKAIHDRRTQPRSWSTFAGAPSRNLVAPAPPKRLESLPGPIRLADEKKPVIEILVSGQTASSPVAASRQPPFFSVISGDVVIVSKGRTLSAYDLLTARRVGFFDLQSISAVRSGPQFAADPIDYTVTVAGGRVFAALAIPGLRPLPEKDSQVSDVDFDLVCLELPRQANGGFHLRWRHSSSEGDAKNKKSTAIWEGSPIVHDGQVFVARIQAEKNLAVTTIDCYDADAGNFRWAKEVCSSVDTNGNRPHLLCLAGPNLIYGSDAGAIVAIETSMGKRVWAYRYPSQGLKTDNGPSPRGLAPAIYHAGQVFAAPADFDGLLCLDARTGAKLWERKGIEVVHLLGVAKGKLIITTAKTASWPAGIRALEVETGADIRGWIQPEDGSSLLSYGRGFLAGDWVFWPTVRNTDSGSEKEVLVLNQEDGQPAWDAAQFSHLRSGNMVFGNGCLAVVDDENLYLYLPSSLLRER